MEEEAQKIVPAAVGSDDFEVEDLGYDLPFEAEKIDITPWSVSVYGVVERMRHGDIDLTPAYQRAVGLWPRQNQSRLIESLMLGIPLPAFYFTEEEIPVSKYRRWQIVDGLQRLCSLRNFLIGDSENGSGKSCFEGLEYVERFNGKTFDDLPFRLQRNVMEAQLSGFFIRSGTPEDVKFNIFSRLNSGGMPLKPAEIRNALYQGKGVSDFVRQLAESDEFVAATKNRIVKLRMGDREFVGRFLAFYLQPTLDDYKKMDSFIGKALKRVGEMDVTARAAVRSAFSESLSAIHRALDDHAFCQYDPDKGTWTDRVNKALFEALTVSVARLSPESRMRFGVNPNALTAYRELFLDPSENGLRSVVSTSTGRLSRIRQRYEILSGYVHTMSGEKT